MFASGRGVHRRRRARGAVVGHCVFGFASGTGLEIDVEQTRVHAGDDWGFATCVEKVRSDDGVGTLAATNVFEKQAGEWKIVHHHAHGIRAYGE